MKDWVKTTLILGSGVALLALWIVWGSGVFVAAQLLDAQKAQLPQSIERLSAFANAFGILGTLITSFTIIIAALQLTQNSDETKSVVRSLQASSEAQTLMSRSQQIELLFDAHVGRYLAELQTGVSLWGKTVNSMHGIRNVLEAKWALRASGDPAFDEFEQAFTVAPEHRTREQEILIQAAEALSHEIEQMGVKCLTSSVPAGVILAQMGGHWALQWIICRTHIRTKWKLYNNFTDVFLNPNQKVTVPFSRRHGYWLAIASALYVHARWPAGDYAVWAREFLELEFNADQRSARDMMWAIYRCDEPFFGTNHAIEALMDVL